MPENIDTSHGLKGVLISLMGLIAAHLAVSIARGLWAFFNRNKGPTGQEFRDLSKSFKDASQSINEQRVITVKMSHDMRRIYLFLKLMAGDKWKIYREQVNEMEENN